MMFNPLAILRSVFAVSAVSSPSGVSYTPYPLQKPFIQRHEDYLSLNFSSPSPLIFHSTFGLLQQWPNTFFPAGHTIAPCTVPKNTNLYHARADADFPPSPEWFALDAEMSYFIAGAAANSHLLTFRTTRDVRCLYFDGTSASLMEDGSQDSQMLLLHNTSANVPDSPFGRPPPRDNKGQPSSPPGEGYRNGNRSMWNPLRAEYDRADGLCKFIKEKNLGGLGWGYEGVIRMNAAFEMIWCNFSSPSVKLMSWLNVSVPLLEGVTVPEGPWVETGSEYGYPDTPTLPPRKGAPGRDTRPKWPGPNHPFQEYSEYDWFRAAAKRYGFVGGNPGRGEARVRIDSGSLFTFYDPALLHQEHARVAKERVLYNLTSIGHWKAPKDVRARAEGLQKLVRRRRPQKAANVSITDGLYMRTAVEQRMRTALYTQKDETSGIDWIVTAQEIVARYAPDLYELSQALDTNVNELNGTTLRQRVAHVRNIVHELWMPYYEYPEFTTSTLSTSFSTSAPESQAALERCRGEYAPLHDDELSSSEQVTSHALSEVLTSICSTLLPVFLTTEILWLANFNNASAPPPPTTSSVFAEVRGYMTRNLHAIEELMAWLGWADQWTTCSPACEMGQVCYIPIWPVVGMGRRGRGGGRNETRLQSPGRRIGMEAWEDVLWEPICVDFDHYPPM